MPINTDLLLEIREQITAHPETHDQQQWGRRTDCGTTHCIAGWAAALTGVGLTWINVKDPDDEEARSIVTHVADTNPEFYARRVTGLSHDDAYDLFFCFDNSRALRRLDDLIEQGKNQ